jgi:hypothetical protein
VRASSLTETLWSAYPPTFLCPALGLAVGNVRVRRRSGSSGLDLARELSDDFPSASNGGQMECLGEQDIQIRWRMGCNLVTHLRLGGEIGRAIRWPCSTADSVSQDEMCNQEGLLRGLQARRLFLCDKLRA